MDEGRIDIVTTSFTRAVAGNKRRNVPCWLTSVATIPAWNRKNNCSFRVKCPEQLRRSRQRYCTMDVYSIYTTIRCPRQCTYISGDLYWFEKYENVIEDDVVRFERVKDSGNGFHLNILLLRFIITKVNLNTESWLESLFIYQIICILSNHSFLITFATIYLYV